jgi:hypothetical protein
VCVCAKTVSYSIHCIRIHDSHLIEPARSNGAALDDPKLFDRFLFVREWEKCELKHQRDNEKLTTTKTESLVDWVEKLIDSV